MGAICVPPSQLGNSRQPRQETQERSIRARNSAYGQLTFEYCYRYYGSQPNHLTKQFLQKNYNPNYFCTLNLLNHPTVIGYKQKIYDTLGYVCKQKYVTVALIFEDVDQTRRQLYCIWEVKVPPNIIIYYQMTSTFDQQGRYSNQLLDQFLKGTMNYKRKFQKYQPQTYPSPKIAIEKRGDNTQSKKSAEKQQKSLKKEEEKSKPIKIQKQIKIEGKKFEDNFQQNDQYEKPFTPVIKQNAKIQNKQTEKHINKKEQYQTWEKQPFLKGAEKGEFEKEHEKVDKKRAEEFYKAEDIADHQRNENENKNMNVEVVEESDEVRQRKNYGW